MTVPAGAIDLGELPQGEPPEVDSPWPLLVRLRRRPDRQRAVRLVAAAVVTGLALLTLTAAGGPVRPAFVPLLTVQVDGFEYDQEQLYAVEPPGTLVAYRLDDGTVRWTAPLPDGDWSQALLQERVLLVTSTTAGRSASIAFDAGTGRRLWRQELGYPAPVEEGWFVFSESGFEERPEQRFTAVDPATGEPVWTRSTTGQSSGAGSTHLVVLDGRRLTSYELTTGEPSATITLPRETSPDVHVAGSLVVVLDLFELPPILTAYDPATLTPRWTVTDLSRQDARAWAHPCGALVCLAGTRPRAIDPGTGETVWSASWPLDGWYVVTDPDLPQLAGHYLLTDISGSPGDQVGWLVDAGTGAPVLDLAGWQLGRGWGSTATPLLVRHGDQTALIGRLHPDLSGIRVLGAVEATARTWCTALSRHLFCATPPGAGREPAELTVWRHR